MGALGRKLLTGAALLALAAVATILFRSGGSTPGAGAVGFEIAHTAPPIGVVVAAESVVAATAENDSLRIAVDVERVAAAELNDPVRELRGRVVDSRRAPVAGATIEIGTSGATLARAVSGEEGRFTLAPARSSLQSEQSVLIVARHGPGLVATRRWYTTSESDDLGTLVLASGTTLRVSVSSGGSPHGGANVRLEVGPLHDPFAIARTDASGVAEFDSVPAGFAWIEAEGSVGGETHFGRSRSFLPEESEVRVALEPAKRFDIHIVDAVTGASVAGAAIRVAEWCWIPQHHDIERSWNMNGDGRTLRELPHAEFVSNDDGRVAIGGLPAGGVYCVRVAAPGYRPLPLHPPQGPPTLRGDGIQRIELTPSKARSVRVPVIAGELPVPLAGTPIELSFAPNGKLFGDPRSAPGLIEMGDRELVIPEWDGDGRFFATTPDGAISVITVRSESDVTEEVAFAPSRSLVVRVVDAAGSAVAGVRCVVRGQGNNDYGVSIATLADGTATIRGLDPAVVSVAAFAPDDEGPGFEAGSVDLNTGDAQLDVVLPQIAPVRLALRIDGIPRLPSRYRVGAGPHRVVVLGEDPELGELRIGIALPSFEFGKAVRIGVSAGDRRGVVEVVPVAHGAEPRVTLDLESQHGTVEVRVVRDPGKRLQIGVERKSEETGQFVLAGGTGGLSYPNGPGDGFRFGELKPGTYRGVDRHSNTVSAEVELTAGGLAKIELDLR
jgi:hypothetical protein